MPQIPVDELPIEAVVVTHEKRAPPRVFHYPAREILHHPLWIVEVEGILAREPAHGECLRNPFLGDGLQPAVEDLVQSFPYNHSAKANHAVVAWDGAVSFDVHHHIRHGTHSEFMLPITASSSTLHRLRSPGR